MLEPIILGEYIILQDNALPVFIAEASIISIINKIYYNRKKSIQNGDKLLGDILTELLEPLKENLEYIKQISHCKKEIVPLSEFDPDASKTYVESIEEEIISYNDDINNLLSLELDPESIFYNTEYDTKLESGKYTKSELESERKIKTIKEIYLQEMREEVKTKLDYIKTEKDMDYFYLFANGITTSMMLMHVLTYYYNPNSDFEKYHIVTLIANIVWYSKYYKNKKKLEKSSNPILKLEKKDK